MKDFFRKTIDLLHWKNINLLLSLKNKKSKSGSLSPAKMCIFDMKDRKNSENVLKVYWNFYMLNNKIYVNRYICNLKNLYLTKTKKLQNKSHSDSI